jgi:hypothetical protein
VADIWYSVEVIGNLLPKNIKLFDTMTTKKPIMSKYKLHRKPPHKLTGVNSAAPEG